MSQIEFLAGLDADIHDSLLDAGLADMGVYTPPASHPGDPAPVAVYIDRDVQRVGSDGQILDHRIEVAYVMAGVVPRKGGTLTVGSETFTNQIEIENDGSVSRWAVLA